MVLLYGLLIAPFVPAYAALEEAVPLLETTQFQLLGTEYGRLSLTIKADEMRQYENGNITLSGGIEIVLFNHKMDKEEGPIHIHAGTLSYNKEKELCIIEGNVFVSKPQQQFSITTAQLWYDMKEEILFTELPIVIADKENVLKGSGLRATRDLTKYTITAPNGTVDIKQEEVLGG
ncbi:MAG: LPS export ABC transporter periplasmic protein LptC [Candidatus Cardinium sp.]|uniref:LPS export ABC transporter periplasmic protein LptC n=1 Tax=Candidatus Cardinium sp. TP TaxID=2961955 RepID=UPI0021AF6B39|nr:LPS export ABC transporter periplasmic protein LptC [Candidatus Cardinium sp. TP]MCT4696838.1 LPS export ABC transporter periplasmic protein LptC [Candidatus Cardinium sp. TP]MDN5247444.1 LPS export ABC transporter periplasmic protein LptC [Candidatus Cardinium sp.]